MSSLELVPTVSTGEVHSFSQAQLEQLEGYLSTDLIKERPGPGGKMLKYITGKTAIDTANKVFGVGRWGYRVLTLTREAVGDKDFYTADIELYVQGCPFPFPGQGEGIPLNNTPDQYAKARKEAVTDALKRALRHFGDIFGLALYDQDALVEDSQGNLTQVKNAHSHQQNGNGNKQPPTKKTVDAANSTPKPKNPVDELKLHAVNAKFITGKDKDDLARAWKDRLRAVFQREVSDQDLAESEALRGTLREFIERYQARMAATNGK